MSRGPGKVRRAISDLMKSEPDGAWTIEDLCKRVYAGINSVEKKHRVSVLRAVRKAIDGDPDWTLYEGDNTGCTLTLVNEANIMSFALGRMKSDGSDHYRDRRAEREAPYLVHTEEQLKAQLAPGGKHHDYVQPDSALNDYVRLHIARRDGDTKTVEELDRRMEQRQQQFAAAMRSRIG